MSRILLSGFLAALVLLIWGFISWEVLPFHGMTIHQLPNEDAVVATLKSGNVGSGAYMIPGMPEKGDAAARNATMEKMKHGPLGMLHYNTEGMSDMMWMYYVKGFLVYLLAAMVASSLLGKLSWSLASKYGARVRFVMMIGVFLALTSRLGDWAWFGYSTGISAVLAADDIIGWTLAGMVIAWRIKPLMVKTT